MDKNKMLKLIREDRPTQVINKVLNIEEMSTGFYSVEVDMESMFFDTKILHTKCKLPYPSKIFNKMNDDDQNSWIDENR